MTHIKGLLRGPKFNGRHSTVIPSAIPAVEAARDSEHVTKIALGVITPIKTGKEHLKFSAVSGGLKMQVRGVHADPGFLGLHHASGRCDHGDSEEVGFAVIPEKRLTQRRRARQDI